ncbi:NEDD8 activating enzyme [Russula vinacea]|nr:NEDD8 activating enzyme [Russula vinacea]
MATTDAPITNGVHYPDWDDRYYHVDQVLDHPGPRTDPDSFMAGDGVKTFLRNQCKILVIGAGGLGCEILANLALSGFKDIHVIDMDTIDISNLNRQFLFRSKDVGQPKATVAAEYIMKRVPGVKVTPYYGKIQDKDDDYYLQFNLVICGLDSVEARRWINATLVNLVDPENPESLKPLIDGGTEEWASVLEWPKVKGDTKLDTDDPEHIQWLYSEFKIEGVTWSLTQGVVKNIIPAIASTNAIIAGMPHHSCQLVCSHIYVASCCNEAFKIATSSAAYLNNYFMLIGTESVYSFTFEHEKRNDCPVCGGESLEISIPESWTVERLIEMLVEKQDIQIKKPSLSTSTKQIYFQAPPQLEVATRPNLEKKVSELVPDGGDVTVTATTLPFSLSLRITYT